MISNELWPFLLTGLTVSILHAALPTHWLPFVLAGRTQKWSYGRTISILMIAGMGHILTTSLIGAGVVWLGLQLNENFQQIMTIIAAVSVCLFGMYNVIQHFRGIKHSHCDHTQPHHHDYKINSKDGWAILSLLSLLTFSPCESFLPIYVSAWRTGWAGFGALTAVLGIGTLLAMLCFTTLFYVTLKQIKMTWLENNEKLIMGIILIGLSVVIYLSEASHIHPT
jgi:nickel/cobalt exporter